MAGMRVGYKRTFQTRPYETQVIELAIEMDCGSEGLDKVKAAMRKLYLELDTMGSTLMADALAKPDPRELHRGGG